MDRLRGKYRIPYSEPEVIVGSNSAVLDRSFVAEALRPDERADSDLKAARGAVNAVLISIAFWIVLGFAIFSAY
jgi:hypothetical protein